MGAVAVHEASRACQMQTGILSSGDCDMPMKANYQKIMDHNP